MKDKQPSKQIEVGSFFSTIQIKYLRHIVQTQVLILILYSFTNPSSPFKLIWRLDPILSLNWILSGTNATLLSLIPAIFMLLSASLFGRVFCGWICPMGLIQDFTSIGKKKNWFPEWFRLVKYAILLGGLLLSVFSGWTFLGWFTPFSLFTQVLTPFRVGTSWSYAGVVLFSLAILFSALSEKRAWCRYVCPLGAVLSLPSVFKIFGISLDTNRCINCLKCDEKCNMGVLDVENQSGLKWNSECILCMACRDICPSSAIHARLL